jgi:UDP:flavonoid glycosyltransferase YjiC (YdhE family)
VKTVLSNPAFRDRALALGASLLASGGYRRAVDAIQAFARSRA